ncbi:glycosyltransferase family 2 protein [Marine Group I thaumarchaeote]|uniref:Glycosyltransferase family 2 protein n=1 Tax=Marine Group I thaumarchaeote TaxID=2511932 RepID=A0A7K4NTE5_9ARCH|nr:glycosyltransferase family 2 protein [Marine Group I thaumarchaeote]
MSENPLVSVIVLNYNAGELLLNCIESIKKSTYKNLEIILVDNISTDKSQKICKEKYPDIKLIQNDENFGYCEGNNIGIREAKGDYIIILNPDTIVESNWIEELISAYNKFGEGLYQPKHLSLNKKTVYMSAGNMLNIFGFGYAREKGNKDENQFNEIEEIGYASGTCLFTSSAVLKKVGLFDPFIFLYHDDLDLGWRASQLGIKSYYVPTSLIYHAESYSLKWNAEKFYWLERNRKYCILTHYSKQTYSKIFPTLLAVDFFVWMFYLTKGFLWSKIKAELDIIKNRKAIKTKYEELESKKIVSDKELITKFSDSLHVPSNVTGKNTNSIFNSVIRRLSKSAKKSLVN